MKTARIIAESPPFFVRVCIVFVWMVVWFGISSADGITQKCANQLNKAFRFDLFDSSVIHNHIQLNEL